MERPSPIIIGIVFGLALASQEPVDFNGGINIHLGPIKHKFNSITMPKLPDMNFNIPKELEDLPKEAKEFIDSITKRLP